MKKIESKSSQKSWYNILLTMCAVCWQLAVLTINLDIFRMLARTCAITSERSEDVLSRSYGGHIVTLGWWELWWDPLAPSRCPDHHQDYLLNASVWCGPGDVRCSLSWEEILPHISGTGPRSDSAYWSISRLDWRSVSFCKALQSIECKYHWWLVRWELRVKHITLRSFMNFSHFIC